MGRIRTPLTQDAYEPCMLDLHRAERKERRVECPTCGKSLAVGSLRGHLASQHDQYQCFLSPVAQGEGGGDPICWEAVHYPAEGAYRCPVPDCPQGREGAGCKTPFNMRYHFAFRHPADLVAVRGYCPPKCKSCGLQVAGADTPPHLASKTCRDLTERRRQHAVAAAGAQALEQKFTAYDSELRRVEQFKYLGRMISMDDNDLPAMR